VHRLQLSFLIALVHVYVRTQVAVAALQPAVCRGHGEGCAAACGRAGRAGREARAKVCVVAELNIVVTREPC
jgi:hypothetical protein